MNAAGIAGVSQDFNGQGRKMDEASTHLGICVFIECCGHWWCFNIEGLMIHFVGKAECKEGLVCYAVAPGNLLLFYYVLVYKFSKRTQRGML